MKHWLQFLFLSSLSLWTGHGALSAQTSGVYYQYNNDDEEGDEWMEVSGFADDAEHVVISSTAYYDGKILPVKYINASGIQGRAMKSITIPSSILSCSYDFTNNTQLEKVIVPDLKSWCNIYFYGQNAYNPLYTAHHLYSDANTEITDLEIPYDVSYVGSNAFAGCTAIKSLTFHEQLTNIGGSAFVGCSSLSRVVSMQPTPFVLYTNVFTDISPEAILVVPTGKKTSYLGAQWGNSFSKVVEAGTSVSIGDYTYTLKPIGTKASVKSNNTTITSLDILRDVAIEGINLPVTDIEDFSHCTALKTVSIPSSISYIGRQAFFDSPAITEVVFEDGYTPLELNSNKYSDGIGGGLFENANHLTTAYIGRNITLTRNYATNRQWECAPFYSSGGNSLTSVTFGEDVTQICNNLLYGCSNLTTVTVKSAIPPDMTANSIPNRANATLYVPFGSKSAYEAANYWKEFKEIVEMQPEFVLGDVNGDETVDIADAVAVVNHVVGKANTSFVEQAADVNGDGVVNIADVVRIVNLVLGKNDALAPRFEVNLPESQ